MITEEEKQGSEGRCWAYWFETASALVGAIIVISAFSTLLFHAFSSEDNPAEIALDIRRVVPIKGGYKVEFIASNSGGEAVSNLIIRGTILDANREPLELSDAKIAYLSANSSRRGVLLFVSSPLKETLEIRISGYEVE